MPTCARPRSACWPLFTAGCVISTAALALAGPGSVALAVVLIIVSNTFYSYGESLTAAFLPELARPASLGKVSGWGWGFGYFGGMLALGLCLGYVIWAQGQGIPAEQLRAGHDGDHGAAVRVGRAGDLLAAA